MGAKQNVKSLAETLATTRDATFTKWILFHGHATCLCPPIEVCRRIPAYFLVPKMVVPCTSPRTPHSCFLSRDCPVGFRCAGSEQRCSRKTRLDICEEQHPPTSSGAGEECHVALGGSDPDLGPMSSQCFCALVRSNPSLVSASNRYGSQTLLHVAAEQAQFQKVKCLLAAGADSEATDGDGDNAMIDAVMSTHYDHSGLSCVATLLLASGSDANSEDAFGTSAAELASWGDNVWAVEVLLEFGLDVSGDAILDVIGNAQMAFLVLEAGGSVQALQEYGEDGELLRDAFQDGRYRSAVILLRHNGTDLSMLQEILPGDMWEDESNFESDDVPMASNALSMLVLIAKADKTHEETAFLAALDAVGFSRDNFRSYLAEWRSRRDSDALPAEMGEEQKNQLLSVLDEADQYLQ